MVLEDAQGSDLESSRVAEATPFHSHRCKHVCGACPNMNHTKQLASVHCLHPIVFHWEVSVFSGSGDYATWLPVEGALEMVKVAVEILAG